MTSITSDIQRPVRDLRPGAISGRLLAGATAMSGAHKVYHGSLLVSDVSVAAGYFRACPDTSSVNLTTSDIFGGIAMEAQSVAADDLANGLKQCSAAVNGIWGFAKGGLTVADIGKAIYATDDGTLSVTSTNALWIGYLEELDATYAWINIEGAAGRLNSAT